MSESKASQRQATATLRQAEALKLRAAGATFDAIANQLGYSGPSSAYRAVIKALQKTLQEPAAELRKIERERLARLLLSYWQKALSGDIQALDRVLKIIKQECELEGLIVHKLDATSNGQTIRPIVVRGEAQGIIPERLVPAREAAEHPSGN